MNQNGQRGQRNSFRTQPFSPVASIRTEYIFDIVIIDGGIGGTNRKGILSGLKVHYDLKLVSEPDLRIRNHRRQKNSVCFPAFRTLHPADLNLDSSTRHFKGTGIVSVDRETGGMSAGTTQLMKRKMMNDGIVYFLRNTVAIFNRDRYHDIVSLICSQVRSSHG